MRVKKQGEIPKVHSNLTTQGEIGAIAKIEKDDEKTNKFKKYNTKNKKQRTEQHSILPSDYLPVNSFKTINSTFFRNLNFSTEQKQHHGLFALLGTFSHEKTKH